MLLLVAGTLCVALAIVGAVVPLLPTTPLLIAAAACYVRSSDRLHRLMYTNRLFGSYLRDYRAGKGMPMASKVATLALLWLSIGTSAVVAVPPSLWWVRLLLLAIGAGVTVHVARIGTRRA